MKDINTSTELSNPLEMSSLKNPHNRGGFCLLTRLDESPN